MEDNGMVPPGARAQRRASPARRRTYALPLDWNLTRSNRLDRGRKIYGPFVLLIFIKIFIYLIVYVRFYKTHFIPDKFPVKSLN